ncbi:MAG TPA: MFS transporter [Haliscomenobacter sp.]|uniref:MFS transporter n=1 Tax=Haliscomenobacter sp. TaxID=2717303 RepID=UPI002BE3B0B2|nr:MFS transporter [Haliscomenobacter sp.]HOY20163.1 MFS transporter [Haliscomenobacter sp.]HPH18952.1 MFS transporter [Haliscomenobacter sp.]
MKQTIFYGWRIVLVALIGQFLSVGSLLVYCFGVFVKPLAEAFKTDRGSISLAVSLVSVGVALGSPIAGKLIDKLGGKKVITYALIGMSLCLFALSRVNGPIISLYIFYFLGGFIGSGNSPLAYSRIVANWFNQHRALAIGLGNAGVGLGALLIPILGQYLIQSADWRQVYIILSLACVLIALPIVSLFLKNTPEELGQKPLGIIDISSQPSSAISIGAAAATRTFWLLSLSILCVAVSCTGIMTHLAAMLTDRGLSPQIAAFAISLFGGASLLGRIANGFLADRFHPPLVAAGIFSGAAIGILLLWLYPTGFTVYLATVMIGLAMGAESDIMPYMVSRYFGMRSMGTVYGFVFSAYTVGAALGPLLFGIGFDKTGSYQWPLLIGLGLMILAIALMWLLKGKEQQE